jgi:gliding motility-associated-like protein
MPKPWKCVSLILLIHLSLANGQLTVTNGYTVQEYIQTLIGSGVEIFNATYNGHPRAIGKFSTGSQPTNLGISSGLVLSTGWVIPPPPIGSPVSNFKSHENGRNGDNDLDNLIGGNTYDAAILEFDFIPLSDTIRFRYVFASEEYPEFVGSEYNDVFGFFLSGPKPGGGNYIKYNIARLPNGMPVSINNVNSQTNSYYFIDNQALNGQTIVHDGFTKVLTAWAKVIPCQTYHLKLAIADASDEKYDSDVFFEANSFESPGLKISLQFANQTSLGNIAYENNCNPAQLCFDLSKPLNNSINVTPTMEGNATFGSDYSFPIPIIIPANQTHYCIPVTFPYDGITEGTEHVRLIFPTICPNIKDTLEFDIHDYEPLTLTTTGDTIICGGTIQVGVFPHGGLAPYHYTWANGLSNQPLQWVTPQGDTTFSVSVSDNCGSQATATIHVSIGPDNVDLGPNIDLCQGQSVTLHAPPAATYHWSTGETTQNIIVSPTQTTTYYATITDLCYAEDSITVFVHDNPVVTASIDPPITCIGDSVHLYAEGADTYKWSSNPYDPTLPSSTSPQNHHVIVFPKTYTTYIVTGYNAYHCSSSAQVSVLTYPKPTADFEYTPRIALSSDPSFTFQDASSSDVISWLWKWNDSILSTQPDFSFKFPINDFGNYPITLVVTNNYDCRDSTIKYVTVKPDETIYIPSAFTPNGDGINDVFHIAGNFVPSEDFSARIYDRWGKVVFVSNDPAFIWNGKTEQGIPLPQDIYTLEILYKDFNGNYKIIYAKVALIY